MKISHLDHLVLTVSNIDNSVAFYTKILGFELVTFNNRTALKFGNQKINLHQEGKEFEPKAENPTSGSADLCFIAETKLEDILSELKQKDIEIVEGIVERTGAMGKIESIYFRDPDLNLIEISNYL